MLLRLLTEALIQSFKDWKKREQEKLKQAEQPDNIDWRHIEDWFSQRMNGDLGRLQQIDARSAVKKASDWSNILQQQSREKANVELKTEDRDVPFENSRWMVVVPKTPQAACKYGAGTRWCTTNPGTAEHYMSQDPLYIVYDKMNTVQQPKTGETQPKRYQLHFRSGSFMDESDRRFDVQNVFDNSLKNFFLQNVSAAKSRYLEQFMSAELKEPFLREAAAKKQTVPKIQISDDDKITLPEGLKVKDIMIYNKGEDGPFEMKSCQFGLINIVETTASIDRSKINQMFMKRSTIEIINSKINSIDVTDSTVKVRGTSDVERLTMRKRVVLKNKENISNLKDVMVYDATLDLNNFLSGSGQNVFYNCMFEGRFVIQSDYVFMSRCKILGGGHITAKTVSINELTDIEKPTTIEADRITIANAVFELNAPLTLKGETVIMNNSQRDAYEKGGTKIKIVGEIGVQNTEKYFKSRRQ